MPEKMDLLVQPCIEAKEGPVKEAFQLVVLLVQALVYIALLMWPPTEGGHQ